MGKWADKPNAVMHAELVTTEAELDELFQFLLDNPMPRWTWHSDTPPHPDREQLSFYLGRGNPIIVARDQDDELWGYFIASRKDGYALWFHVRREVPEAHDVMSDGSHGMTENSRQSSAHMNALAWKVWGEGVRTFRVLADPSIHESKALDKVNIHPIQALTERIYHEHYADNGGEDE